MSQLNKYIIIREDLLQDPMTIITDGLLIGRLYECELLLNHPAVSRAQAGIRSSDDDFYIFNLRASNPVKLNGKSVERNSALAPGDILEMGPFLLEIDQSEDALIIRVTLHIGMVVVATDFLGPHRETSTLVIPGIDAGSKRPPPKPRPAPLPGDKALDIFWEKRIREAGKVVKTSALFPMAKRKAGKAQFNWSPTSDLTSRWPASVFVFSLVTIGLLSVAAALWFTSAYAPAPISNAHVKSQLEMTPPIAAKANANACTNCHTFNANMEANCASCHNTSGFTATVIEPHAAAGIGCVSCHAEHRGRDFKPGEAAFATCTECHTDANRETYGGKKVGTPHGGTLGYPVVNGQWTWQGLNETDWKSKKIAIDRLETDSADQWRSKQFHALHVQRIRAVPGQEGNTEGELSCSTCHKSFNPIDRQTPRETCGGCHNGRVEPTSKRVLIAANQPNCTSCHVQHVQSSKHWNRSLLAPSEK